VNEATAFLDYVDDLIGRAEPPKAEEEL